MFKEVNVTELSAEVERHKIRIAELEFSETIRIRRHKELIDEVKQR